MSSLDELMRRAIAARDAMTPHERFIEREKQRIDFAYGNLAASTNHRATWKQVHRVALEMWLDEFMPDSENTLAPRIKLENYLMAIGFHYYDALDLAYGLPGPRG